MLKEFLNPLQFKDIDIVIKNLLVQLIFTNIDALIDHVNALLKYQKTK